jgi:hypothetical protein
MMMARVKSRGAFEMTKRAAALWLILTALTSPALAGIEMTYDESADFSGYHTYAWAEGVPANRLSVQEIIRSAVDTELRAHGLRLVESDPDLLVATYVLVDRHSLKELSDPTQWEFWTGQQSVNAYQVQAGTLVIDLTDARTRQVAWRSLSSRTVKGSASKNKKKLPMLIRKMFRRYPPGQD